MFTGKYSAANSTVRLICRVCKKISFNHTCHRQHVVSKHFQDFWADKCPDQTGLFHCHHCDYQATDKHHLIQHIQSLHEGIKYPCPHCDYQARAKPALKKHILGKHTDTFFISCKHCDYQTKWASDYLKHKKQIHGLIEEKC